MKRKYGDNFGYQKNAKSRGSGYTKNQAIKTIAKIVKKKKWRPGYSRTGGFYKRPEVKFLDTTVSNYTFDTTGEFVTGGNINTIPQNDTESGRDGRECVLTSIQAKGEISLIATNATSAYQLVLVQDTQCNGTQASYTDIWASNTYNSMLNLSNSRRFKIIKVFRGSLTPTFSSGTGGTTTGGSIVVPFDFYTKCRIPLEFDSTAITGALATIRSNNLAWYAISSVADDVLNLQMTTRVRFQG